MSQLDTSWYVNMRQECSSVIKVIAKNTNNISYTVKDGLGISEELPCM